MRSAGNPPDRKNEFEVGGAYNGWGFCSDQILKVPHERCFGKNAQRIFRRRQKWQKR